MRWADLPNALVSAVWALLLLSGLSGIASIQEQHAIGYPAPGQWVLYVGFPALFLSFGALSAFLSRRAGWFYDVYPFAVGLIGFCILPVLLFWGGGV